MHLSRMCILLVLDGMSDRDLSRASGLMLHQACVSLLILCLVDLSISVSRVLKSPTIIVLLLISHFKVVSNCLIYCGDLVSGT